MAFGVDRTRTDRRASFQTAVAHRLVMNLVNILDFWLLNAYGLLYIVKSEWKIMKIIVLNVLTFWSIEDAFVLLISSTLVFFRMNLLICASDLCLNSSFDFEFFFHLVSDFEILQSFSRQHQMSSVNRNDPRRRQVKKGLDADDARRKREEFVVELRRNKREEQIQKRRARSDHSVAAGGESAGEFRIFFFKTQNLIWNMDSSLIAIISLLISWNLI